MGVCDQATLDADMDTGTAAITLASLEIAAYGHDLDGMDNFGRLNVAGCLHTDLPAGGVDSSLYLIDHVVYLNGALHSLLSSGGAVVEIRMNKLATGANDPCLGITATLTRATDPGHPITSSGYGQMTNHVIQAFLDGPLDLSLPVGVSPQWCNGGVCNPATLDMAIRSPRVTVTLDAAHAEITRGILSGFVFYGDVDPAYAAANATGLQAAFSTLGSTANLTTQAVAYLLDEGDASLDLHMNTDGTLSPCTGSASSVDANAISAGLIFYSE